MMQTPPPPSLEWCLFLDVDGTLLEVTDSHSGLVADPEIKTLLREVAERLGGALALLSCRSIRYLDELLAPLRLPAAGLHGVERRKASGAMHGASFVDAQLDPARRDLQTLVAGHPGTWLEDRGRTLVVHYRAAPDAGAEVREAVIAIAKPMGRNYHVEDGHMTLEVKPRGFSKAAAIRAFMKEPPFSGRRPVFLGDHLTDKAGFGVVEDQGGISVAVGDRVRGLYRLENATAVRSWFEGIAALHDSHRE